MTFKKMAFDTKRTISGFFEWFKGQPEWQQKLAESIYLNKDIDHETFAKKCLEESNQSIAKSAKIKENIFLKKPFSSYELKLASINDIQNICGLKPKKPFILNTIKNLNIIYGQNSSGKSSYIRILKSACGSKDKHNKKILHNIYKNSSHEPQSCSFSFLVNEKKCSLIWNPEMKTNKHLALIEIFDEDSGKIYINEENTVSYEPYVLSFISEITDHLVKISSILKNKKEITQSKFRKLCIPPELHEASSVKWYQSLDYTTKQSKINEVCSFSREEKAEMDKLVQNLEIRNPEKMINSIEIKKKQVNKLKNEIEKIFHTFNIAKFKKLLILKQKLERKRKEANLYSRSISNLSSLKGFGSDSWKNLFIAAREYSEQLAYEGQHFPVINNDSKCVLCQQDLSTTAEEKLKKFDEFMKGKLERELRDATEEYNKFKRSIEEVVIITDDQIKTLLETSSVEDESLKELILDFFKLARERRDKIEIFHDIDDLPLLKDVVKGKEDKKKKFLRFYFK